MRRVSGVVKIGMMGAVATFIAPPALASNAPGAAADPLVCYSIEADDERLACYDGVMAALSAAGATSKAAALTREEAFGAEAIKSGDADDDFERLFRIEAPVTRISANSNGMLTVELENGQIWRQLDTDGRVRTPSSDVAYTATIKRFMLGRYTMKIEPTGSTIRVNRIK